MTDRSKFCCYDECNHQAIFKPNIYLMHIVLIITMKPCFLGFATNETRPTLPFIFDTPGGFYSRSLENDLLVLFMFKIYVYDQTYGRLIEY